MSSVKVEGTCTCYAFIHTEKQLPCSKQLELWKWFMQPAHLYPYCKNEGWNDEINTTVKIMHNHIPYTQNEAKAPRM